MSKTESVWKPVADHEGIYEINIHGQVRSIERLHKAPNNTKRKLIPKIQKQRIDRAGYWTVKLRNGIKEGTKYVHRLLALAFLDNPLNKPMVDHINGDKLDNRLENLRWATHAENMKYAYRLGLTKVPPAKSKKVVDTCTGEKFNSIAEAAKCLNLKYSTCQHYLSGYRRNPTCLRLAA